MKIHITVTCNLGDVEVAEGFDYDFRDDARTRDQVAIYLARANAKIVRAYGLKGAAWDNFKEIQ